MPQTQAFGRQAELIIGAPPKDGDYKNQLPTALRIQSGLVNGQQTGLRVQFKVEKSDRPEPNKSQIVVFNLADPSRRSLEAKGVRCILSAGYPGTVAQIFSGEARFIDHVKQGVDWATQIQCGDGERAYQFPRAQFSLRPGASLVDVVKQCIGAMQLDPGAAIAKIQGLSAGSFFKGYTANSQASTELTRALAPYGVTWSIQDGRVVILGPSDTLPEIGPVIGPDSGLIGSPAMGTPEQKGGPAYLKLKSLLQPGLKIGTRFQLKSSQRNGFFRVHKVVHSGDTFGGEWYSEIEASPV